MTRLSQASSTSRAAATPGGRAARAAARPGGRLAPSSVGDNRPSRGQGGPEQAGGRGLAVGPRHQGDRPARPPAGRAHGDPPPGWPDRRSPSRRPDPDDETLPTPHRPAGTPSGSAEAARYDSAVKEQKLGRSGRSRSARGYRSGPSEAQRRRAEAVRGIGPAGYGDGDEHFLQPCLSRHAGPPATARHRTDAHRPRIQQGVRQGWAYRHDQVVRFPGAASRLTSTPAWRRRPRSGPGP